MLYKDFIKRGISVLLAAGLAVTALPGTSAYAENGRRQSDFWPDLENGTDAPKEEVSARFLKKKGKLSASGYQEMVWVDENGNEVEESADDSADTGVTYGLRETFPSRYSMEELGELPAVRNQGRWGTCWAHAALSSIETNMVKKGLVGAADVDYSERHLAYFSHRRNNTAGDGEDNYDDTYGWYGGGSYFQAIAELSGWYGAASESDFPYDSYGDMEDLTEDERSSSVSHMTNANILSKPEEIKRSVMENGAVMCSFHSGSGTLSTAEVNVYNAERRVTDHAVSIVGWDDSYPKTKFDDNGRSPAQDGAWRCRNSWGGDWAEAGYFWISYEDASIGAFCSFEAENADNYDHIYQYDGADYGIAMSYEKAANVFCAEGAQELRAVSFQVQHAYDYVIEVYVEGEEEMTLPSDGILLCRQQGSFEYPGYHLIPLDASVLLESGMKYAVGVRLTDKSGDTGFICMEMGDEYSAQPGESFVYYNKGWMDTTEAPNNLKNVCIKAFTDDVTSIDKSKLLQAIRECEAENLKESDYTAATWAKYLEMKQAAEALYQSAQPSEHEIVRAVINLKSARNALKPAEVLIADENSFVRFIKDIEAGSSYEGQTVRLRCDLDMRGVEYHILRMGQKLFQGTFDGGGHSISNLSCRYGYSYGGLFGQIGNQGAVKDLILSDVEALELSGSFSGGIAGINEGTIRGCKVTGENLEFASSNTGGIAGSNKGTIENCAVEGSLYFTGDTGQSGGIAGSNDGRIARSFVSGEIVFQNQTDSAHCVGGIGGFNRGTMEKCYVSGEINSDSMVSIGGIAGYSYPESVIRQCYNLAAIKGNPANDVKTGGIGVYLYGTTSGCYNYGTILRTNGATQGAIYVYKGTGTVSNCYYLDVSSDKGGYSPRLSAGKLTAEEFASAKAAYYLNSSGGEGQNTYEWSQSKETHVPIWADGEHGAVIKVQVRQKEGNQSQASLHGVTEGVFYETAGTKVRVLTDQKEQKPGYAFAAQVSGFVRAEDGDDLYILPEADVTAEIDCQMSKVLYKITYHFNRGTGTGQNTYDVESRVELMDPVREGAEFLGWYDNAECLGEPVKVIPVGSTGDKEFWAKWHRDGHEVVFPQKKGYEIESCDGYTNGKIEDDGSYLFTVRAADGYDISNLVILYEGTPLGSVDGVYRIDHIVSDIEDISIEGILLAAGNYTMESYNGYVGETCALRPAAPAVGIKLVGDGEFGESITVNTEEEIQIVTCDEEENVSGAETVRFRRDLQAPEYVSNEVLPHGAGKYISGVSVMIHAVDEESGISEYSFDNGQSWQKENLYYVPCGETASFFERTILIRDYAGNTQQCHLEIEVPALLKCGSKITLNAEKAAYLLGTDVSLNAEITFEEDVEGVSEYGMVRIVSAEGTELGAANVTRAGGQKGTAKIVLLKEAVTQSGELAVRAVYDGTDTIFQDSESNVCRVTIAYAAISNPVFSDVQTAQGSAAAAGAGVLGEQILPTFGTVAAGGKTISYRIAWDASITIDLTKEGNSAIFTGTITYENVPAGILIPESRIVKRKVSVKKAAVSPPAQKPVFADGATQEAQGLGIYQVIDAKKNTARLVKVSNPNIVRLKVPATVSICGVTCKVTEIGNQAAKNCKRLRQAVLGKHVTKIGKQAFFNCKKLKTIQIDGKTIKTVGAKALKKTAGNIKIRAKKMNRKQKTALLKKLRKAGVSKKAKVK